MLATIRSAVLRRSLAGALMMGGTLVACSAQAASFTMYRDASCGCCSIWADRIEHGDAHSVETVNHPDMRAVKTRHGVPVRLQSCHTTIVEGYVIEGHVPLADIERLLAERPAGVTGLAVPGMPIGSPGMEHGSQRQAYQVIAFGPQAMRVWASYPARSVAAGS